jgi:hypothetical protein
LSPESRPPALSNALASRGKDKIRFTQRGGGGAQRLRIFPGVLPDYSAGRLEANRKFRAGGMIRPELESSVESDSTGNLSERGCIRLHEHALEGGEDDHPSFVMDV